MKQQQKLGAESAAKKPESLVDAATSLLRDRILNLSLEPGSRIDERVLLDRFSLSRTPVREALNRLSTEGLVIIRSNRGAYVAPLDLDHVRELLDAYISCERTVGFLCRFEDATLVPDLRAIQENYAKVQKARAYLEVTSQNASFHRRIAEATKNKFVTDYAHRLYGISRRISYYVYQAENREKDDFLKAGDSINAHHKQLIEIIDKGQRDKLVTMLTEHALLFGDRVQRIVIDKEMDWYNPDWGGQLFNQSDS